MTTLSQNIGRWRFDALRYESPFWIVLRIQNQLSVLFAPTFFRFHTMHHIYWLSAQNKLSSSLRIDHLLELVCALCAFNTVKRKQLFTKHESTLVTNVLFQPTDWQKINTLIHAVHRACVTPSQSAHVCKILHSSRDRLNWRPPTTFEWENSFFHPNLWTRGVNVFTCIAWFDKRAIWHKPVV